MNLDGVIHRHFPVQEQSWTWKDSALYALGLGFCSDPLDTGELRYVYEQGSQLAVPSQCLVLGWPGIWHREPETGIDWKRALHGEQFFEIHRPLQPAGAIKAHHRVLAVDDKGPGRGLVLHFETRLEDADTGEPCVTLRATQFLRGDGGSGSHGEVPSYPPSAPLTGEPDRVVEFRTIPQAALLYRLSGDDMPLHADPAVARDAGFDRPILHGLCSLGIACRAILQAYVPGRPEEIRSMFTRFTAPVYPGETLRLDFFEDGDRIRFRARVVERDVVVLDRGECALGVRR